MIIKSFEIDKIKKSNLSIFLLYGQNEGLKKYLMDNCFLENYVGSIEKFEEKEIIENLENIFSKLFNKSLFESKKLIIISRTTDKILKFIDEVLEKGVSDVKIILLSGILEKKSKLRNFFEKNKNTICIPFYPDDNKKLSVICQNFFKKINISVSREIVNLIVEKSQGDRNNLEQELKKIENFCYGNIKNDFTDILKLVNLSENYSVSELVDSCLSKNLKSTIKILNGNIYTSEDCMLILRTLLNKTKRLMTIRKKYEETNNLDEAMTSFKPPIFWKDKEIVKKQILKWDYKNSTNLIFQINDLEKMIKLNSENSLKITYDFILSTTN